MTSAKRLAAIRKIAYAALLTWNIGDPNMKRIYRLTAPATPKGRKPKRRKRA